MTILMFIIGGFVGLVVGVIGTLIHMLPKLDRAVDEAMKARQEKERLLDWNDDEPIELTMFRRKCRIRDHA